MIKLTIAIIIAAIAGLAWLRTIWAKKKNRNVSKKIVGDLKSGKHNVESYADSLDMTICSRPLPEEVNLVAAKQYFNSLGGKKVLNKFDIAHGEMNENRNGIVVAEGTTRGFLQAPGTDTEVNLTYPCWLYVSIHEKDKLVSFRSVMPENADHHQLLEDLSGEIYKQCMKQ